MPTTDGTATSEGTISMKLLRNLGPLTARPQPRWYEGWFKSERHDIPVDYSGRQQSWITLTPALFGKVFRADLSRLMPEQIARLKQLLLQNIDVDMLVSPFFGEVTDYGLLATKSVTTAGVNYLATCFNNNVGNVGIFKFHAFGTGTNAENITDVQLQTELTTQYATDNVRPTGSQGAATNVYTTIGTLSPDTGGTIAITEHGIFNNATGGGVTLWDRSVFSAINLVAAADSLQVTYNLTLTAGG